MKEITKAQEEVLKALWRIEEGAVADVISSLDSSKPAYTTIATVLKVLEKKGYVAHKTYGKTFVYYPLVSKKEYATHLLKSSFHPLFDKSINQMVSTFVNNKKVSLDELEELKQMIEKEIAKKMK